MTKYNLLSYEDRQNIEDGLNHNKSYNKIVHFQLKLRFFNHSFTQLCTLLFI